ncbi:hypothetical protein HQQ82_07150 [Rathayibacter sp. VKM Ac-2856]|uniref:hypothetical protein n=1 Tax=unclassified Rathayibacter TaxID=2609250 RepID=UPI001563F783|nr:MULTISPECIES: hypothetical protein [unclassified Rathayibacter]NQX04576.1 hypothetical protein [Rathayibacter sp. VKM Ac-2858]NQX19745.1 hypothetical protein [Rathayibacter sp. VKM Ac-2856]
MTTVGLVRLAQDVEQPVEEILERLADVDVGGILGFRSREEAALSQRDPDPADRMTVDDLRQQE